MMIQTKPTNGQANIFTTANRLEQKIAHLETELAQQEKENAYLRALTEDVLAQNTDLVADLRFNRHMAALWKRAAKEQWHFKQLVNEYVQALKAEG